MSKAYVRVELDMESRGRFKLWALTRGTTMQDELASHVERCLNGTKDPARKPVSRRVESVPSRPGSTLKLDPFSGEPREVPMKKCSKCFDVFPVADMVTDPKSGKLFCGDCADNMRNQQ